MEIEVNRKRTEEKTCEPVEQEENHEKGPLGIVGIKSNGYKPKTPPLSRAPVEFYFNRLRELEPL
jgi:hypothetical protein